MKSCYHVAASEIMEHEGPSTALKIDRGTGDGAPRVREIRGLVTTIKATLSNSRKEEPPAG